MRKVAAFTLRSPELSPEMVSSRFDSVVNLVGIWRDDKGKLQSAASGQELLLKDGRIAEYCEHVTNSSVGEAWTCQLTEPTNNAIVRTSVAVAQLTGCMIVYVEVHAAGGAYQLGPMRIDIFGPRLIGQIVQSHDDWYFGETPISVKPLHFAGAEEGKTLEKVLWHSERNLPVVVMSSYEKQFLTETFADDIASELVGVALVVTVDSEAAWAITALRGREWSCFNGAIRLYWPKLGHDASPTDNPLWTRLSLLSHSTSPKEAARAFRRQMRRQLLGLSAFAVSEPMELAKIRQSHAQNVIDAARAPLRDADDWKGLAESYADENVKLQLAAVAYDERVRDLEAQVANLQLSLQWREHQPNEIAPESDLPPSTLAEAVEIAKRRFHAELVFGEDVDEGLRGLAQDAGPPEKVLAYLENLAAMVAPRSKGALGMSVLQWLQDRGVNASSETEIVKNSQAEVRKRTWHYGGGTRFFDLHLKPNDATHPDRCVRIYFDYDEERRAIAVGWVGRHP